MGLAGTTLAETPNFDNRAFGFEIACLCDLANRSRSFVIIDMDCFAAFIADQEDAIMFAAGVRIGEIGIGTLHSQSEVVRHEQVKNAIDTVGCNTFTA